jgi:hypothetical protein
MFHFSFLRGRMFGRAVMGLIAAGVMAGGAGMVMGEEKPSPQKPAAEKPAGAKGAAEKEEPKLLIRFNGYFPDFKIYSRPSSSSAQPLPEEKPFLTSVSGVLAPFPPGGNKDDQIMLKGFAERARMSLVQVVFTPEQAAAYLKAAGNLAPAQQEIYLLHKDGKTKYYACGYMVQKGESLDVTFSQGTQIKLISDIKAVGKLGKGESLYLVFYVPTGVVPEKLVAANKTVNVEPPPAKK